MVHFWTAVLVFCVLATCSTPAYAQQVPENTACNEESGLTWMASPESDVNRYRIYEAPVSNVEEYEPKNILSTFPSDVIEYSFTGSLGDGAHYFTVTVLDTSDNESGMSNEIGCMYNGTPGELTIKFIFTKPLP